jgi:hypothetical protein
MPWTRDRLMPHTRSGRRLGPAPERAVALGRGRLEAQGGEELDEHRGRARGPGHADLDFAQFQAVVVLHGVLAAATLVLVLLAEVSG